MLYMYVLQERIVDVEAALEVQTSFRGRLQECEKWVLQMSFKLMAHNTLNVASPEATQQQIDQHQVLGREQARIRLCRPSVWVCLFG